MFRKRMTGSAICLLLTAIPFSFAPDLVSQEADRGESELRQVKSGYVGVGDGELFYEQAGSGEHLVMLHDGLLHRVTWDDQFQSFSGEYTVTRYDRRGYGRSSKVEGRFSNVRDLYFLFDELGIERAGLMGMSAGGGLAIDFALAYPDKVSFLVLVGSIVSGMNYTPHMFNRGGHLDDATRADPDAYRLYWVTKDPYEIHPENVDARKKAREAIESNPQNLDRNNYMMIQPPDRPAIRVLDEISVPTLVVVGEHDIPDVHAHCGAISGGIPNAERIIVSGAAHLVPIEKPDVFNQAVRDFIKRQKFFALVDEKGFDEASAFLRQMLDENPGAVPFTENDMNLKGYEALQDYDIERAITLFRLNVLAYPNAWNTYDSLAEAYLTRGDRDRAIEYYEKSLELNPDNTNATQILEQLK